MSLGRPGRPDMLKSREDVVSEREQSEKRAGPRPSPGARDVLCDSRGVLSDASSVPGAVLDAGGAKVDRPGP